MDAPKKRGFVRSAAAKLVRRVARTQTAYCVSAKSGALRYGEVEPEDLCGLIDRFCLSLNRNGEFWDLGSGSGLLTLTASLSLDLAKYGGIEIQNSLHELALSAVNDLEDALASTASQEHTNKETIDLRNEIAQLERVPDSVHDLANMLVERLGPKRYKIGLKGNATLSKYLHRQLKPDTRWQTGRLVVSLSNNTLCFSMEEATNASNAEISLASSDQTKVMKKPPISHLVHTWRQSAHHRVYTEPTFICGDIFETSHIWAPNAALIFANVLLFDAPLITKLTDILATRLPSNCYIISSARLDDHPRLSLQHSDVWCRSSWTGGVKLFFYQLALTKEDLNNNK